MSWLDKQHQKIRMQKMIDEAMRSEKYQAARKEDMKQAALRGLGQFCFIGLLWLEMNFRCGRKGMLKFLDFAKKTVIEIGDDVDFLKASNKYYKENYDIDVLGYLGMEFVEVEDETH